MTDAFTSIDEYIASFPDDVRVVLENVRTSIRDAAPAEAAESISYDMPTVSLGGKHLIYFAGWKHHIALYGIPPLEHDLEVELAPYRGDKGTVKLPLAKPIPYELITRVVTVLVERRTGSPGS